MGSTDFFAIDIGSKLVKVVEISRRSSGSASLSNAGQITFPDKIASVVPSIDQEDSLEMLSSVVKSLVSNLGIKSTKVVAALPDNVIFTKLLTLPVMDVNKMEEVIYWESKGFVPMPLEDVQIDWIEINRVKGADGRAMVNILVIAAPTNLVEGYLKLFDKCGYELIALEVKSVALARLLEFNYGKTGSSMVIDFGASSTDIAIIHNGKLVFSQSLNTGSDSFTKAIVADFGLDFAKAEQYKINFGLDRQADDQGKIFNSIKPVMDVVVGEVGKVVAFVNSRISFSSPQNIYLCGNGALLPKLPEYLQTSLGLQTVVLDSVKNMKVEGRVQKTFENLNPVGYSVAMGLGLKNE